MNFERDFKNLEDIDCITFSFIDHVDHDRKKGIKIPPILEESYRMTLCLYDKVSNSKNKEYDAEEALAAAKVTCENVDDCRIVYEQCRRIADSDAMSLFLCIQDLKYITAWNTKTIILPELWNNSWNDICKYCWREDCNRHNPDAVELPQEITYAISEFFKEKNWARL
jgi:hypothetical protein